MNEQEKFWAGQQGSDYMARNYDPASISHRMQFWDRVFDWTEHDAPHSALEIGANVGFNLTAIDILYRERNKVTPRPYLAGIEINDVAYETLCSNHHIYSILGSFLDPATWPKRQFDLVFTMGVLIHVAEADLGPLFDRIAGASAKYVVFAEYFSPKRRMVNYRGVDDRLWADDFAGRFLDRLGASFRLADYGFAYHRDPDCPLDDLTWFAMEKIG